MKKVHLVEVGSVEGEAQRLALPDHVQLAMFEIAESAKEGLLALAVGAGLAVLHECMEHEVDQVVGPKGRHNRERTAKRHGQVGGEVTLGGRRVPVNRPRLRTADDSAEIALESYREFAARDLLERVALERMLARVSTRRYGRAAEPVGAEVEARSRSTSRSAVSRAFVHGTRAALDELLARDLSELELAIVMIDGIELAGLTHVVALGITTDGTKVPLSLREGSSENATVATALLADLAERGLRLHERSRSCSTAPRRCARRCATSPARAHRSSAASGTMPTRGLCRLAREVAAQGGERVDVVGIIRARRGTRG